MVMVTFIRNFAAVSAGLVILTGCLSVNYLHKEGSTYMERKAALVACRQEALALFPVKISTTVIPGQSRPTVQRCEVVNGYQTCTIEEGFVEPPEVITRDDNKTTRELAAKQCLINGGFNYLNLPLCKRKDLASRARQLADPQLPADAYSCFYRG